MKRPSIKDIAKIAGVSVATVSYVLNNKEGQRISEETKKKIFEIAETIKYVPNKIARSLQNNQSKLLGLIVADISNDFYSELARYLEDIAFQLGYTVIIGSCDENAEKFAKLVELFSQQQVDGLIVAPVSGSESTLLKLQQIEYPVITIDRYLKGVSVPGVILNNREIAETTTSYLVNRGFQKMIYVGYDTQLTHLLERREGFEAMIAAANRPIEAKYICVGLDNISIEIHSQLATALGDRFDDTALYFSSNKLALAGLSYLIKKQIKVPEEISVVAFDETEAYQLFPAEITFIKQPLEEMAEEAMKLLVAQMQKYNASGKKVILSGELVIKNSVK